MRFVHINNNPITPNVLTFGKSFKPVNWYHRLSANMGLYDRCSFSIIGPRYELEEMFENGLGRNVERYSRDGNSLIWQGYIHEMTLTQPGMRSRVSLENMYNEIRVRYTALNTATNPPGETPDSVTSDADDTPSQNIYGTKTKVYRPPYDKMTSGMADQLRDTLLGQYKLPRRSDDASSGQNQVELKIFSRGYIHTLDWRIYNQTVQSGTDQVRDQILIMVADVGEFIDRNYGVTNNLAVQQYYNDDQTAYRLIEMLTNLGDASDNRYVSYVGNNRAFRYEKASTTVGYYRRMADSRQRIKDTSGRWVPNWEIRPNQWLRTVDVSPFYVPPSTDLIDDPQAMFIETAEWYENGNRSVLTGSKGEQLQVILSKQAAQGEILL